jgi:hypothetical protein
LIEGTFATFYIWNFGPGDVTLALWLVREWNMKIQLVAFTFVAITQFSAAAAPASVRTLNLAVEPSYSAAQATEVYKPFVEYLQRSTGYKINLVVARNFPTYWSEMRAKKGWDLMLDEAHFTSYRIKFFKFEPLVKAAENSSYSLLSAEEVVPGKTEEFLGDNVETLAAPSLAYAMLLEYFPNPMQQPEIRTTAASWNDAIDSVFADEARAAMVPTSVGGLYPNMFTVVKTRDFPGIAMSASPNLDAATKAKIKDALLKMHQDQNAFQALTELRISQFVPTTAAEYNNFDAILKGFFGYGR